MRICNNILSLSRPGRALILAGMFLLGCISAYSQTIIIGGDIYGGGRQGAVGTAKVQRASANKDSVQLKAGALTEGTYTTDIRINSGSVRTVFGGGENGRTYGNTSVTIQGNNTQVGSDDWQGSIYGGLFGAGDGESAYVFGHTHLFINGGSIAQNVYGGGNRADLMGTTNVQLSGGELKRSVFGGARLANIFGYSFVNINGAGALSDLVISTVYGGNDIAGNINSSRNWSWTSSPDLPIELGLANANNQFTTYNAFVFASPEKEGKHIFVGQLYGGGNGDYVYARNAQDTSKLDMSELWDRIRENPTTHANDTSFHTFTVSKTPEVDKVYLELKGGTYGYVYGGGNNATVTGNVDICLNNQTLQNNIHTMALTDLEDMGLHYDDTDTAAYIINGTGQSRTLKSKYQFDRVFGGNNKVAMNRQPEWHITKASINNLYSGGNAGDMTVETGLLLTLTSPDLEVNNVYGGCRRADVAPNIPEGTSVGTMSGTKDGFSYNFPKDHSARILIGAGKINNVYGGNDISGKVKGGNAIDIQSSILGDVYGGGNGSYAYTDNAALKNDKKYGDFYYNPGSNTLDALNDYRPNAEQAWIHVSGRIVQGDTIHTVIGGSLYLGGNSATLDISESDVNAGNKNATLKIGSYVIAKNIFLGSNGENMIDSAMLAMYHDGKVDGLEFNSITMNQASFTEYIKGVSVGIKPKVVFDDDYDDNSTKIGSLFFGGNLGSVTASGTFNVTLAKPVIIFEKLVAGCNDANYKNIAYGIDYKGGITTAPASGAKINMTLDGITLMPGKIQYDNLGNPDVVYNVVDGMLQGGNIFGGCYNSGYINGDVVIGLTSAAYDESALFKTALKNNSGVTRDTLLHNVVNSALSMFGGGYGPNAFIEGNTTINISSSGRILKVFGGGLQGPVNGNTTINLTGGNVGKIYGGGFEGRINGSTAVYLDGGTVHSAFGGACNADIRDYAQIYVGKNEAGVTTVQNSVYGGNDFGGTIEGLGNFSTTGYVTSTEKGMAYNPDSLNVPRVLTASAYVEYVQGNIAKSIFGGSCGSYDYTSASPFYDHILDKDDPLPHLASAFVHFKGNNNARNNVVQVFGAGEGAEGSDATANIQDKMQERSYVLVNSTIDSTFYRTDIFGAGAFSGLGMQVAQNKRDSLDAYSAVVDLMGGRIKDAYGASYNEGVTRRTVVNVPARSEARMKHLFGGGYGSRLTSPCDVYESHVNWSSSNAICDTIYGANNNSRRTLYTFVNINSEAWRSKSDGKLSVVFGAGCGKDTWAEFTEVNLNNGAKVCEVYGGGFGGKVLNLASVKAWAAQDPTLYTEIGSGYEDLGLFDHDLVWANLLGDTTNTNVYIHRGAEVGLRSDRRGSNIYPVTIDGGYGYGGGYGSYNDPSMGVVSGTAYIGLHGGIVWKDIYGSGTLGSVYDIFKTKSFTAQTNVYIEGGTVRNVYGAGWKGRVGYTELPVTVNLDNTDVKAELAKDIPGIANVEIGIPDDRRAIVETQGYEWGFYKGVPTVERNAYSSGEDGGCVIGTSKLTIHNGYIGYRYYDIANAFDTPNGYETFTAVDDTTTVIDERYLEKTYDETWTYDKSHPNAADGIDRLTDSGNAFGGGYTDNATADHTIVTVWGGHIRNSVYGGGEVAAIGRGEANEAVGSAVRTLKGIYQSGSTQVNVYSGYINRNVFGGGKGYNNNGTKGKLLTDGYVFGTTEVNIYGGEIGTDQTVLEGDGNVFGGGNIGYVFNSLASKKDTVDGYYYLLENDSTFWTDTTTGEKKLSEDCRVIVTPYAKVLDPNGVHVQDATGRDSLFKQFDFIPTSYLNLIRKNDNRWYNQEKDSGPIDQTGIIIRNAIFAGGNVSSGNELYANTKTVFGNATATVNDLYYIDLITVGTEHIGGLYGDGNLTRVDGYRELNITNYGTDYYGMNTDRVTLADYHKMNDRERAYFQLKYMSKKYFKWAGNEYSIETVMTKDEIKEKLSGATYNDEVVVSAEGVPSSEYWEEYGFVSIYAGRLINTLQRADFVGVFGSRMVMQGARDRVPETVDFTDYTINRVGEVSLNQVVSPLHDLDTLGNVKYNGNYFGIYNIVNHLAALTSDVDLDDIRVTEKDDSLYLPADSAQTTYYGWKYANKLNRRRNDGKAPNKIALASGVYLELTTEKSTDENKDWGLITGVLELDLINVMPGLGGGYVYAKNEHGIRYNSNRRHITLSDYNKDAVSYKKYLYYAPADTNDFQTSGNLVSSKTIIDDCYPTSDSYVSVGDVKAAEGHYWYIKGEIYVYDLYLSGYTGAADAYSRTVSIPLTITAGSHGKITLQDVKPNKYMYYSSDGVTPLASDGSIIINNKTYLLNDTLSYWDWLQLSETDQKKFVDTTYITVADFLLGTDTIHKGYVLSRKDYDAFRNTPGQDSVHHIAKNRNVPVTEVFRMSNDMSHNKGYALTLELDNPEIWNKYYTGTTGLDKRTKQPGGYLNAPTYKVKKSGIFGQRDYGKGDIITKDVYDTYQSLITNHPNDIPANNATFEPAYVMNQDWSKEYDGIVRYFNKGLVMSDSAYRADGIGDKAGVALFCVETWKLESPDLRDEYVFYGTSMTEPEIRELGTLYGLNPTQIDNAINTYFDTAYYCLRPGKYGGNYYVAGNNYLAKTAWSAMNPEDRKNFEFNYDAFDVLIDSTFSGSTTLYDGKNGIDPTDLYMYSSTQHIDYSAKNTKDTITYIKPDGSLSDSIPNGKVLNRIEYESLPNEQYHYSPLKVGKKDSTYYIVKTAFNVGNTSYSIGNVISPATFGGLTPANQSHILQLTGFPVDNKKYYYCRESYTVGELGTETNASGQITDVMKAGHPTYSKGNTVPVGTIIDESGYDNLPNVQKNFTIHGKTPVGVSTLYVSGQSNILDLSKGRIYTITYLYDYEESDEEGNNINQVNEKHIVNIHVNFQGGTPTISQISNPPTVLPGSTVGMTQPRVTPGAYEVIGGGWEIFVNEQDANNHENGAEFINGNTPLYWYNDDYYLAYYAKTYLGKTYSNAVPFKVGNYHDLSRVMKDTLHHMYVDHPNVKRNSKIYLSDNKFDKDTIKNELDMLKDFYDLSMYTLTYTNNNPDTIKDGSQLNGHIPLNKHVKGGQNLDFILKTDIKPLAYKDWTPIGESGKCFEGTLHGDGHTIDSLNNSLFGYLCGEVYNLGVTGTFTGPGIANNGGGHIENAWINTTGAVASNTVPVFGGTDGTVVNAYYPSEITAYAARDGVTARPYNSFHNGEVAYDLNGFYLAKRYAIATEAAGDNKYYYTITDNTNNRLSGLPDGFVLGTDYVAKRYADGDFIYASGSIPDQANERMYNIEPEEGQQADPKYKRYFPIYPDDYIFFGQMLTYGYSNISGEKYQEYPSSINRADRNSVGEQHYASQWIVREETNSTSNVKSNRVYRAPAYFGNSTMGLAHFNANTVLPDSTKNKQLAVYPGMTALDLTGYNDNSWNNGWSGGIFMTKVLDYNHLIGFRSDGQTRNLLVYTPYGTNTTNTILTTYLADQNYSMGDYNAVEVLDYEYESRVKGHLVHKGSFVETDKKYHAAGNQFLVDKQNFNAPIEYNFDANTHMWYQRTPERFVESMDAGWDVISLPFTAEYVTTQTKGELTHFYSTSKDGHEYWLREYNKINSETKNEVITTKAMFKAPDADSNNSKIYGNTFLWDYYYSRSDRDDKNEDKYYEYYSDDDHEYEGYPFYAAGQAYLIGLPGLRFYEFDLSGQFLAKNTYSQPGRLSKQTLTFISPDAGTTIRVTDLEYDSIKTVNTHDGYIFTPTYQVNDVTNAYIIAADGSSFRKTAQTKTVPFRAYMTAVPGQGVQQRAATRAAAGTDILYIGYTGTTDPLIETPVDRGLSISGQHMQITIESTLDVPATVNITTTAGRLLKQFVIQPGTKVTVPVNSRGIYIVNRHKIAVTK